MAKRRLSKRLGLQAAAAVLGLVLLFGFAGVYTYVGPGPKAKSGEVTAVVLPRGAGVGRISRTLEKAGVITSAPVFAIAARLTGAASQLKAGEYEVRSGQSMASILSDIRAGRVVRRLLTIPEGWTSGMVLDAVNSEVVLTGTAMEPPEGSILPDSYEIQRGQDREAVIQRMRDAHDKLMAELWPRRAAGLPFTTPQEAVTLASIVEKETGVPSERPRVAAIFINRLKKGMLLQTDPTIIYGLTKGRPLGRGIRASELAANSPWNSYKVPGLPPGPIANPGRASLEAVLNPMQTNELYFVANGTGGHAFASTYEEHAKNVARWRQIERDRAAGR
jgi:UPF0755 protein